MRDSRDGTTAPAADSRFRGRLLLERLIGRNAVTRSVSAASLLGVAALAIGLGQVSGSAGSGFTWGGAFGGVLSQLAYTGPAAVLISLATSANVLAGAIVLRSLGTPAFRSLSELILAGFAAAVVLDAAALFLLGSFGLFGWPELLALHLAAAATYAATRATRPLMAVAPRVRASRPAAWWLVVAPIWAGPLIVGLASPAAPFLDVLPNHVAPVEHVRVFGSFATLTTSPSPIYGPSRLMLGYIGLLGDLTTIANLEAILAVAAFALPLSILMAISMRHLASRLFGASAGFWVLVTFPLTFTFMRLADTRGTVVAFPLAAFALAVVAEKLRAAEPRAVARAVARAGAGGHSRPDLPLAAALAAAVLVHPLVGLVTAAAAVGMLLLEPRRVGPRLIPALGAAVVIAIPEAETLLGIDAPSWSGFLCIVAAVPIAFGLAWVGSASRLTVRFSVPRNYQLAAVAVAVGICLVAARLRIPAPYDPASEIWNGFPRLLLMTTVGVVLGLARAGRGWVVLGSGIAAAAAAWEAAGLIGVDTSAKRAIFYEVTKTLEYWLPVMLALGAAGGIAAVLRLRRPGALSAAALAAFIVFAMYPYPGPLTRDLQIGEHRGSESLGLAMREAEVGYWFGYPDPRLIVNPLQQEVIDKLRAEVGAGRLGPSTRVLHVAASFRQWASVPIGVFVGALETSISLDPEASIHTEGGRLFGFDRMPAELASGYGYVVFERKGLDPDIEDMITSAGYHLIWGNSIATVYVRT